MAEPVQLQDKVRQPLVENIDRCRKHRVDELDLLTEWGKSGKPRETLQRADNTRPRKINSIHQSQYSGYRDKACDCMDLLLR